MEVEEAKSILSVLIIEDNPGDQLIISEYLRDGVRENFLIQSSSSLAEGVSIIKRKHVDAVLLDLGLPDSSGLESVKIITELNDSIPIIVLTINNSDDIGMAAIERGAQDYLIKDELQQVNLYKSIKYAINRKKLELQLRTSLELFENTFEQAAVGLAHMLPDTSLIKVNKKFCEILGYSKSEMIGKSVSSLTFPEDLENDLIHLERMISGETNSYSLEKRFVKKDGTVIWTNIIRTAIYNNLNEIQYFFNTVEDITDRKKLQLELQKQKSLLDNIISILPVGLWIVDDKGALITTNKRGEEIWSGVRYSDISNLKEFTGWWAHNGEKLKDEDWGLYRAIYNKEVTLGEIINIQCFDGSLKTIINSAVPLIIDGEVTCAVIVNEDITGMIEAEEKLKASVTEKELLIKESHHRIKNNLQLISSLLMLSLSNVKEISVKSALTDTLNRIVSISTLHEYLYRSSDYNRINVQDYLYKILDYVRSSLATDTFNIRIIKAIDNFEISSGLAISLGLIINELVTNSIKYAFKDKSNGIVNIEIRLSGDTIMISIKDNGIGLNKKIDFENIITLGFQIVYALIDQHKGTIDYKVEDGTEFIIRLPAD